VKLVTEADAIRALENGTHTLASIYSFTAERVDTRRDGGHDEIHPGDLRWKRRVRGGLETMRRTGHADRIGRTVWAIHGTPVRPQRLLLIVAGATPLDFELRLAAAVDLLRDLDEPADLVLCDPPYALGRGEGRHYADGNGYRRDHNKIVGGYTDIDPAQYADFTHAWVTAAARSLRPGGQLAVVTGPQRTGVVQCAAETAGLTWVCKIAAGRQFPIATKRRPAPAHWDITVMCRGAVSSPRRVFHPPVDLPAARSGHPYPRDWWPAEYNGRADRPGLLRYDNSLPLRMVLRIVRAFSDPGALVVDPCLGGGTSAVACWQAKRRFIGSDVNPGALMFTGARLLAEHAWPDDKNPALFSYTG
jgi:methylase of polypeptide subunit release factors